MLTPEYLSLLEFNDIVKLYEQLNIDITVDIINRVSQFQEITATTKEQLKILKQTNGTEIFNSVLQKTALLTKDTKETLKDLYKDVAKEDLRGYEKLYEYRGIPFKLSENQYKILNQGLNNTNRALKNFTKTIAFESQRAYVNAVDKAYMQAVTGAFGYDKAIDKAVKELAKTGITLKDKLGRNVQLEVAIRRNVLTGIRETANNLERDIEKYLGCDGYEVTAHYGARPTHAEAQGKQYAINRDDAKKYDLELWKNVEHLWSEYNCRHAYFGIILGISEPIYNKSELGKMKNAKVILNGEEVPYYKAAQKQKVIENEIRKTKREIQILQKTNQNLVVAQTDLKKLKEQYTELCDETGLKPDNTRTKVINNNLTKDERYSINKYISSDFYVINEKLRKGIELSKDDIKLVNNLDSALDKLPNYNGLISRSLELSEEDLKEFLEVHQEGKKVTYPAYTSTTCGEKYNYNSNVELYIYSQNGKNMLKYNLNEREILYKRDSNFKVKEVEHLNGTYHIMLEEINE